MCVFTLQIMPQNRNFCFVLLFGLCIISRQNGPDRVKNTAFCFKVRKPTFFWNHAKISHTFFSKVQKLRIIIHSPMTTYKTTRSHTHFMHAEPVAQVFLSSAALFAPKSAEKLRDFRLKSRKFRWNSTHFLRTTRALRLPNMRRRRKRVSHAVRCMCASPARVSRACRALCTPKLRNFAVENRASFALQF